MESFVQEFEAFAAYVAGKPSRIATGEDGARAVEIAVAASRGLAQPGTAAAESIAAVGAATAPAQRIAADSSVTRQLSVVVLPFGSNDLAVCLDALAQQDVAEIEVIVAHDSTLRDASGLSERFGDVRFLAASGVRPPAQLRAMGATAASGEVVAFLEGHCIPAPDWCATLLRAHKAPHAAVGGPIEKGMPPGRDSDSALNWSIYLSDYSRYMLPLPEGPMHSLSDCNVSYKRAALDSTRLLWQSEFHENVVNGALRDSGSTLWFDPGMVVLESRELTLGSALRDRFSFGRLFGSTRVTGQGLPKRVALAGAALLMPPLLAWRAARNALSRRRHRAQVFRSAGHLLLVAASWMVGEAVGYVTGTAGRELTPEATRPLPAAK